MRALYTCAQAVERYWMSKTHFKNSYFHTQMCEWRWPSDMFACTHLHKCVHAAVRAFVFLGVFSGRELSGAMTDVNPCNTHAHVNTHALPNKLAG